MKKGYYKEIAFFINSLFQVYFHGYFELLVIIREIVFTIDIKRMVTL